MPQRLPILTILLLFCAGLAAAGQFAKLSVPFDTLQALYPDGGAWLGFVVTALSFLGLILGLVAGLIVARHGPRRLLLAALGLGAVLSFWQAALPSLPYMLLSRMIEGIPHLLIVVAAPTLMVQLSPEKWRSPVMTLWSTFFGVAFAITGWLGMPLVAAQGLPALLLVHGVFMTLMLAALWPLLPPDQTPDDSPAALRDVLLSHPRIYADPRQNAAALGWIFYTLTYVALLTVLPAQMAPDDRAWAAPLMPLAGLVTSLTLGMVLLRRIRAVTLTVAGFGLGLVLTGALIALPHVPWLAIALMGALGFVQCGSFAAIPQLNHTPQAQARAYGAIAQTGNLGNLLGTPLLLAALSLGGVPAIFAALALAYAAGAGVHLWQDARRRRV